MIHEMRKKGMSIQQIAKAGEGSKNNPEMA